MGNVSYFFSIGIIVFFVIALISLDGYGRNSRLTGQSHSINDPQLIKMSVDSPEQAYSLWKLNRFKGRVVVSLSRRLNFVTPDKSSLIPGMSFPLKVFNLSRSIETDLRPENFLLVAVETNIAREVIHIVPEMVFYEKLKYAGTEEGVTITEGRIKVTFFGSPRVITTMSSFEPPDEPVLLYINASIFRKLFVIFFRTFFFILFYFFYYFKI